MPLPEKPKKVSFVSKAKKKSISPQPEPPGDPDMIIIIDGIVAQLEELKKQIEPLVELQKVIMKMK